jgi:hypothetical protein
LWCSAARNFSSSQASKGALFVASPLFRASIQRNPDAVDEPFGIFDQKGLGVVDDAIFSLSFEIP